MIRFFYPGEFGINDNLSEIKSQQYDIAEDVGAVLGDTLSVDTQFVVEEIYMDNNSRTDSIVPIPDQYIGMNREQFIEVMNNYCKNPPLQERKKGLAGVSVASFSGTRVVVEKTYGQQKETTEGYYIAAYDNKLRVYLFDKETVFMETEILLEQLPKELQQEVIFMLYMESETQLYDFLEAYTS